MLYYFGKGKKILLASLLAINGVGIQISANDIQEVPPAELALYVDFDGNINDKSGNKTKGTIVGDPTYIDSIMGKALHFENPEGAVASQYVNFGKPENLQFAIDEDFSISFWANTRNAKEDTLVSNKDWKSGADVGFNIAAFAGYNTINYVSDKALRSDLNHAASNHRGWVNYVYTINRKSVMKAYENNVLVGEKSIAEHAGGDINAYDFVIGATGLQQYGLRDGEIDEVRVYKGVLSEGQRLELYNDNQYKILDTKVDKTLSTAVVGDDLGQYNQADYTAFMKERSRIQKAWIHGADKEQLLKAYQTAYKKFLAAKKIEITFEQPNIELAEMSNVLVQVTQTNGELVASDISYTTSDDTAIKIQRISEEKNTVVLHAMKEGTYQVNATTTNGETAKTTLNVKDVPDFKEEDADVKFADFHAHTGFSDSYVGTSTPSDAYKYAKDGKEIDMQVVSDHHYLAGVYGIDSEEYKQTVESANLHTDKNFIAEPAFEGTYDWGHVNIFKTNFDAIYGYDDFVTGSETDYNTVEKFYKEIVKSPTSVVQLNHPAYHNNWFSDFSGRTDELDKIVNMIEVYNDGNFEVNFLDDEASYIRALDQGWHVAPAANSDTHYANWGKGYQTRTGIITDGNTSEKVFQAIRERRAYASQDRNLEINYKVNGKLMGTILENNPTSFDFDINIKDPDISSEADKIKKVEIVSDIGTVVKVFDNINAHATHLTYTIESDTAHYYYVRVTTNKDYYGKNAEALTAPVWTGREASGENYPDLVLDAKFEGNLKDSSSRGNNGVGHGDLTYVDGRFGKALKIENKNGITQQYVDFKNPVDFRFHTTQDFTLQMWFKTMEGSSETALLTNKNWYSGSNSGYAIALDPNNGLWTNISNCNGKRADLKKNGAVDNKWHFLSVTFNRDEDMITYVDGEEVGRTSIKSLYWYGTIDAGNLMLGADILQQYPLVGGYIDELQVFRSVRSPEQIKKDYNRTAMKTFKVVLDGVTQDVEEGAYVVMPTPKKPGHRFDGFFEEGEQIAIDFSQPISRDIIAVSHFTPYTLNINTEQHGHAIASSMNDKGEVTLRATADDGYEFVGWYANGALLSEHKEHTLLLEKDMNITAVFRNVAADAVTSWKQILSSAIHNAQDIETQGLLIGLHEHVVVNFKASLKAAIDIYAKVDVTSEELMNAWSNLADAMHYLDFKANKTQLAALLEEYQKLDLTLYKDDDNMKKYVQAKVYADSVMANELALEKTISIAYNDLLHAKNNLQLKEVIDVTVIDYLIRRGNIVYTNKSFYNTKTDSWNIFEAALTDAKAALSAMLSQDAIDSAAKALGRAYENIRLIANEEVLGQLRDFVHTLEAIDESKYAKEDNMLFRSTKAILQKMIDDRSFTQSAYEDAIAMMAKNRMRIEKGMLQPFASSKPEVSTLGVSVTPGVNTADDSEYKRTLYISMLCAGMSCIFIVRKHRKTITK